MDDASGFGASRGAGGRFGPGNPGRPRGARNRLSQRVALSLLRYFEEHEAKILDQLTWHANFPTFLRLIGRMLPQGAGEDGADLEDLSPDEAALVVRAVRVALERVEAGQGSLAEVQEALAGLGPEVEATVKYGGNTVETVDPGRPAAPAAPASRQTTNIW